MEEDAEEEEGEDLEEALMGMQITYGGLEEVKEEDSVMEDENRY